VASSSDAGNIHSIQRRVGAEYDLLAPSYMSRWSRYVSLTEEATLARLPRARYSLALDVGCGTGGFLAALTTRGTIEAGYGLDLSFGMLRQAAKWPAARCLFTAGSAESLPFQSASFDLVLSLSALHFWPEPGLCLREFHRVLAPNGDLLITDWCDNFITCRICDWYLRRIKGAYVNTHTIEECENLLRNTGFSNVEGDRFRISWLWGLMTVRGRKL